mgnify:CR=1 FL=1
MFSVILKVFFTLFLLSILIYLFQLKERFFDLTSRGWNKIISGVFLLSFASLLEILKEFPQLEASIFSHPAVAVFLKISLWIGGLGLIIFGIIAWLVEQSRLKKKTEEKEKEFLFLESLNHKTKKASSLIESLDNFLKEVNNFLAVESSLIWITNPATGELILATYRGLSAKSAKNFESLKIENSFLTSVAKDNEALIVADISTSDGILQELEKENLNSLMALPLLAGEKNLGVLALCSSEKYKFETKIKNLLENVTGQLAEKIETLRLSKEVKRKTEQLTSAIQQNKILSVVSGYLVSNLDMEQILDRLIWEGLKVIEAEVGHIFLIEGDFVTVKATLDPSFHGLKATLSDYPWIKEVLNKRKYLIVNSNLLVPIFAKDRILGVLWYENKEGRVFTSAEVQHATALANLASLALQIGYFREELSKINLKLKELEDKRKALGLELPGPNFVNDINNILAAILGNTQLLQNKLSAGALPYNPDLLESLKLIEQSVLDGSSLINKLQQSYTPKTEKMAEVIPRTTPKPEPMVAEKIHKI